MADLITEPGEYRMTKAEYEADPVKGGSLRSSVAWLLASKTPAHARWALDNPTEPTQAMMFGTAIHELILGHGNGLSVIDAASFQGQAARMAKRTALAQGKTPILAQDLEYAKDMVAEIRRQLRAFVDYGTLRAEPFQPHETGRVIVWREGEVWCRAEMDGLSLDGDALSELKTEGQSADQASWMWKARKMGYSFRLQFYARGLSKLGLAHSPQMQFIVAETEKPHLVALHRVDDELAMREDERVTQAIKLYGQCQRTGRWPGYSLEGYDLTLTERERMVEQQMPGNSHVSSDDIAATL